MVRDEQCRPLIQPLVEGGLALDLEPGTVYPQVRILLHRFQVRQNDILLSMVHLGLCFVAVSEIRVLPIDALAGDN
jgi:hypothetical protein